MKPKFLLTSLSSCSGCVATIFALEIFPEFFEKIDFVYVPFLKDQTEIQEADIALIEGCVSEESQVDILREIRKKSRIVIALGTCAAFGGILSLSTKEVAERISNHIDIDGFIPGCPTPSKLLGNSLIRLLEDREVVLSERNLCYNCPLRGDLEVDIEKQIIHLFPEQFGESEERSHCFIKDNILCLGPVTRDGCEHLCIESKIPCEGCMGPVTGDFTSNVINFLSTIKLSKDLRKYEGIFFRFAKPKIKGNI